MNVINFSGGRTSAYMTKRLMDQNNKEFIILFQNTGKEMPQTLDFINECDKRWNLNVIWIEYRPNNKFEVVNYETASRKGEPFDYAIQHHKTQLPNNWIRYCTKWLKIDTSRRYLKSLGIKEWTSYIGIRYDEPHRWSKKPDLPNYVDVEMPLVSWKISKYDILEFWSKQEFDLKLNDPYGNCDCCFLKGKNKLAHIAKENPQLLDWWIQWENKYQGTFKKEISYQKLIDKVKRSPNLFDQDVSFDCFCNVE